ncbi:hypothetical protein Q75_03865 [Bacillus coahuilensis p1.1.43]|uniref:Dihydrolipoyl dehydrogenase n=1 Tax=Bacillus coahuilensis p1.1.43 TaxID=1150625 RepID=A0A147KAV3_9BACI|nr:FAD-dependent oxidoreductase [Bacillus coahuilensis]KUP07902.1 hypothetical protein Q75_03865 [Bacillus coahuilensis p1.1.43]
MVVGEMVDQKEIVVVGGGPGGYHAAIRAAQLGKQVTIIEKGAVGGVCLHEGCIPSKALAHLAHQKAKLENNRQLGLIVPNIEVDLTIFKKYKISLIQQLNDGIEALLSGNGVEVIKGTATFVSSNRIGIERDDSYHLVEFNQCIIATGGKLSIPHSFKGRGILSSKELYQLEEVPEKLLIYGNDTKAIESAFSFNSLGTDVTIIMNKSPLLDSSLNKELIRTMKKRKISCHQGYDLLEMSDTSEGVHVTFQSEVKGLLTVQNTPVYLSEEVVPNLEELGVERIGIETSMNGFIKVNEVCETSIPFIYAIGDVTGERYATKAIRQGKVAAEHACQEKPEYDDRYHPTVIYSIPPIVSVGLTEEEASQEYIYESSLYPLRSNGTTALQNEREGFIKMIAEKDTGFLIGIHMMGEGVVELSSAAIIGLEMAARKEDFTFPFYPHPSMNEALIEAVEALDGKAIHMRPKTKLKISNQ